VRKELLQQLTDCHSIKKVFICQYLFIYWRLSKKSYTTRLCYTQGMKLMITIGIFVFSSLGGWLGTALDHGNFLGGWSLLLGTIGSFVGIWAGYKVGKHLS
jgi:hypothetical protein